jgi:hypothetical protein
MAGRAATPQGRKLGNINNMPNRKYLPSINFSVPFARWSHFYVSIDWINYSYAPESCLENDNYKLYFDRTVLTDIHIKHQLSSANFDAKLKKKHTLHTHAGAEFSIFP